METALTAGEFFRRIKRENNSVRLLRQSFADDDEIMTGRIGKVQLRRGLSVHYSDVVNHCDMETESRIEPHLSIKLLIAGGLDASVGGVAFSSPSIERPQQDLLPLGIILSQCEPEIFYRHVHKGDRITKFNISILPEWLSDSGIFTDDGACHIAAFCREHLACSTWVPSAKAIELAKAAMRMEETDPYLRRLHVESCTLPIIAEAFRQLENRPGPTDMLKPLSRREKQKLTRVEALIADTTGSIPSVEEMASVAGVSINSLQRLFHIAHGMTVSHYIRMRKLKAAQNAMVDDGLTIAEAAYLAGYRSAANFSTAFKRQFGYPPSAVSKVR